MIVSEAGWKDLAKMLIEEKAEINAADQVRPAAHSVTVPPPPTSPQ
jgi:hypothetical protein